MDLSPSYMPHSSENSEMQLRDNPNSQSPITRLHRLHSLPCRSTLSRCRRQASSQLARTHASGQCGPAPQRARSTSPSPRHVRAPGLHLAACMAASTCNGLHRSNFICGTARLELSRIERTHSRTHTTPQMGTMKAKIAARSAPALVLLLCLCLSPALASYAERDVEAVGKGRSGSGSGSGGPYHFGEERFRHWTRTRQGRFRVLERFTDELLEDAVGSYRVAVLEAAPRAFLQPSHYDADEVMYVREGEGVVSLLLRGRRESFCVREGDVLVIPAGAVVYSANTHDSDWFRVVMLLSPVSTPGRFEEFFPAGGERPESFFSVFSDDVLQAAFNTRREEWEQVFERQRKGEITSASEEQIRELSRSCSRGGGGRGGGGSGSSEWEIKPSSLTGKRPRHSNNHGRHFEITGEECPHLRMLDMEVGLANITRGSMMAPSYSTRATKIAVVVEGSGYFEMACPHLASSGSSQRRQRQREHGGRRREEWGREGESEEEEEQGGQKSRGYQQVRSRIREGSVIVIPAGHPTALVAGEDENLAVLCFGVHAGFDEKVFLAGRNGELRQMDAPAKALAFGAAAREVDRVLDAQPEAVFLRGPHGRGAASA
ncbi:hypothetical protein ACP70R_025599 [Stipagrostis hirtigluma subsp. patula]